MEVGSKRTDGEKLEDKSDKERFLGTLILDRGERVVMGIILLGGEKFKLEEVLLGCEKVKLEEFFGCEKVEDGHRLLGGEKT